MPIAMNSKDGIDFAMLFTLAVKAGGLQMSRVGGIKGLR